VAVIVAVVAGVAVRLLGLEPLPRPAHFRLGADLEAAFFRPTRPARSRLLARTHFLRRRLEPGDLSLLVSVDVLKLRELAPEFDLQLTHDLGVLDPLDDLVEGFKVRRRETLLSGHLVQLLDPLHLGGNELATLELRIFVFVAVEVEPVLQLDHRVYPVEVIEVILLGGCAQDRQVDDVTHAETPRVALGDGVEHVEAVKSDDRFVDGNVGLRTNLDALEQNVEAVDNCSRC